MGAQRARMEIRCDKLTVPSRTEAGGSATMPALSGSASLKQKTLTVTMTNPSLDASIAAQLHLSQGNITDCHGTVLTHAEMNATNTFEQPENVHPISLSVDLGCSRISVTIPKHSIASLELKLS